ncbi:MAG: hypothetical protein BYD32DRAFT_440008 [Podila humilis]|nr:MAG: hypothetical protein BYD32DRAFT_440008 [Podila humilis]
MYTGPLTASLSMVDTQSKSPPASERSSISASRSNSYSNDDGPPSITTTSSRSRESLGQLSLQRFPTGESENKVTMRTSPNPSGSVQLQPSQLQHQQRPTSPSLGSTSKSSRATSVVSTGSGRSSSGSGFRFPKPNLSFKPLYSHSNDSKSSQHHRSTPDPSTNSPFPPLLLTIRLPQSLLNKYVIDQESFRFGKGIWGIGKYSWTVTVISRSNGKKYVIKRVSKSLLPPSAYYHYPTTAHQLCTCPACRSSRDQLLLTGQLNPSEMDNIQEVLIIQNKGRRKELPQLPSPQPPQSQSQSHQRPLSASSLTTPTSATPRDKRRSFNMYSCNNASQPNPGRFLGFSPLSSPQETPANSRPTTPSPSPLRQQTNIPSPAPLSPSGPLSSTLQIKTHRSPGQPHPSNSPSMAQLSPHSQQQSPLLPSATPPSWPQSDQNNHHLSVDASFVPPSTGPISLQDKTAPSKPSSNKVWTSPWPSDLSSGRKTRPNSPEPPPSSFPIQFHAGRGGEGGFMPMPSRSASESKKRPTLQRHRSTPNLSRPVTGLDSLEEDPARLDQIRNLSKLNVSKDDLVSKDTLFNSPLSTTLTLPILSRHNTSDDSDVKVDTHSRKNDSDGSHRWSKEVVEVVERRVDPFDTQGGELKRMEAEGPRPKPAEIRYTPPPHALPMELVLLQTFNDSDHLPEHHEWTQDQDYWYYVTKAHGVKRRKLKKVSSWWLDMSSLGGALLSGSSSSSSEPIATGPIYNMGRATPLPSSPLSSEVALSRHMPKDSISSLASQDSSVGSATPTMAHAPATSGKKPSSPRNSHLGKYYYVDWEEYTSL